MKGNGKRAVWGKGAVNKAKQVTGHALTFLPLLFPQYTLCLHDGLLICTAHGHHGAVRSILLTMRLFCPLPLAFPLQPRLAEPSEPSEDCSEWWERLGRLGLRDPVSCNGRNGRIVGGEKTAAPPAQQPTPPLHVRCVPALCACVRVRPLVCASTAF